MTGTPEASEGEADKGAAPIISSLRLEIETAATGVFALGAQMDVAPFGFSLQARHIAEGRDVVVDVVPRPGEALANALLAGIAPYVELRSPHIGRIFGARRLGEHVFVERQRPDGRSLADMLQSGPRLPLRWVGSVLAQIGAALELLHRAGIEAGAPRPERIWLDADGNAVLGDVARPYIGRTCQRLGPVRVPKMEWEYSAPEQFAGSDEGAATDQYALGCIAYELVAGVRPYGDLGGVALISAKLRDVPRPLRERRPDCPPALEAAVARMLSREPGDRYGSIAEAIAAAGVAVLPAGDPLRRVVHGTALTMELGPVNRTTAAIGRAKRYENAWIVLLTALFVGYGAWSASTLRGLVGFLTPSPPLLPLTILLAGFVMLFAYFYLIDLGRWTVGRLSGQVGRAAGHGATAVQEQPPRTYTAAVLRALPGLLAGVLPVVLVGISLYRATVPDLAQRTPGVVPYEALLTMHSPPRVFSVDAPLWMAAEVKYWPQQRSVRSSADVGIAYVPLQSAAGEPVRYVMSTPRLHGDPDTEVPGPYLVHAVALDLPIPVRRDLAGKGVRFADDVVLLDRLNGAGAGSEPSGNHEWIVPFVVTGTLPFMMGLLAFVFTLRRGIRAVRKAGQSIRT